MTPRRWSTLLCSAAAHVVAFLLMLVATAFTPAAITEPARLRNSIPDWEPPRPVRLVDIPLTRRQPRDPSPTVATQRAAPIASADNSSNAAPVIAPDTISQETGREGLGAGPDLSNVETASTGVVDGAGQLAIDTPTAPRPSQPIRLHSGITPPRKVVDVPPVYPDLARQVQRQGIVILEVTIDAQGHVADERVLRSVPLLDQAALDAVRRWVFTPARLNGEPVPVVMTVTVQFVLNR